MSPAIPERVAQLILDVQAWAAARSDVLGVALVGSYARQAATPESDADLVVVCRSPSTYLESEEWIKAFGAPNRTAREDWGRVTSVRVWYADGLEVEFGIADRDWGSAPLDAGTRQMVDDGCVIVFDRGTAFSGIF
ncbi:MAG: nucleotidyltransferase domain-containing protein [Chloroflexi bacterium]|nr:nucleotidyltransferase domain-containing protein [Chloroflexota bacterium]